MSRISCFKFVSLLFCNLYAVLGAIFGSLEIVHIRSVGREQYLKGGVIPDWCSLLEAEEAEERNILTKVASIVKIESS